MDGVNVDTAPVTTPSPPPTLDRDVLRETLSEVVREFFDSYSVPCAARSLTDLPPPAPPRAELGSIISLRGKSIGGGLAFVAPVDLIARLLPVPRRVEKADQQVRDWCGEITNQLLGRLKNKLAAYSLDFEVGTPVCFFGRSIRLVFLPDAEGISLGFEAASYDMRVHLDCTFEPAAIRATTDPPRIAAEGDFILF